MLLQKDGIGIISCSSGFSQNLVHKLLIAVHTLTVAFYARRALPRLASWTEAWLHPDSPAPGRVAGTQWVHRKGGLKE